MNLPAGVTINNQHGTADCATCGTGVNVSRSQFASHIIAAFIVQHASHARTGTANGLTASGKPSKAGRAWLATFKEEPE